VAAGVVGVTAGVVGVTAGVVGVAAVVVVVVAVMEEEPVVGLSDADMKSRIGEDSKKERKKD